MAFAKYCISMRLAFPQCPVAPVTFLYTVNTVNTVNRTLEER